MNTTKTLLAMILVVSTLLLSIGAASAQSAQGVKFRNAATLTVTFLNQDPDPAEPGSYVDVRWKVENLGNQNLKDIRFVLDAEPPFSLNDPSERTKSLGDIGTQQIEENAIILHWRLKIDEDALEGDNELKLSYFIDDVGIKLDPFKINIKNRQALIAVDKIDVNPSDPTPGKMVNLTIRLRNVADTTVQDLKVHLDLAGTDLAAVGSTNERVINKLPAGENAIVPFTLVVDPNAQSNVHLVLLSIEYANKFGDDFKLNTSFGVMIAATTDYLVNLEKTEVYTANSKGKVTVSVSNTGKSDLNFVTIDLLPSDAYSVLSASQVYIGNLKSDDFETGEFNIYVSDTKKESIDLLVRVTFKDAYNNQKEEQVNVPLKLYSVSDAKRIGLVSSGNTGIYGFLLVVIIALIIEWRRHWKDIARLRNKTSPKIQPNAEEHKRR